MSAGLLVVVAALAVAAAAALLVPGRPRLPGRGPGPGAADPVRSDQGWMVRFRPLWSGLAGFGAAVFVGGGVAPAVGVGAAVTTWVMIGRAEPPAVRRRREAARRDLPHVVNLFASALRSGSAPGEAVAVVCAALPGPATERLSGVAAKIALGVEPGRVWAALADDPDLAPLGRTLARAHATGAPIVRSVERLADELARLARSEVEDRARAVGVKAALPLGLCLLPSFLLIGIVPLVAGLAQTLSI